MRWSIALTLLLAALGLPVRAAAQAPPFLLAWGSPGSGDGQFVQPHGAATDPSGNVYVTDAFQNSRVQVFDANGVFLRKFGSEGTGPGEFTYPEGVALDRDGNIYVSDGGRDRVQKFTNAGAFITQWGTDGSADGQFRAPYGVAVDASSDVYVVDECRVQKFTSDGTFLLKWDVCGSVSGILPVGIAVEPAGTVLVSIVGSPASIRRYSSTGVFLGEVLGPSAVRSPAAIAVDGVGRIYEAEGSLNRIQVFTGAGALIAAWGSTGSGPGQFQDAIGIAVGPHGEIYVSDRDNARVQKFGDTSVSAAGATWGRLKTLYR